MQNTWSRLSSWLRPNAPRGLLNNHEPGRATVTAEPKETATAGEASASAGIRTGFAGTGSDLTGFDEVYRAAAVKPPKLGYSIGKIVEMANSEHIRGLGMEMKRRSLLMALEAAGVQLEEVLQDASQRQRVLNAYETAQRKNLDDFEARKLRLNCEIQAELERITAEYTARIGANLDEVAREKDVFRKWQSRKQQESQRMAEAVALCVSQGGEGATAVLERAPAVSDTGYVHRVAISGFPE